MDIRGLWFGKLQALVYAGLGGDRAAYWLCRCECGGYSVARGSSLRQGRIQSCGCQRRDPELKRAVRLQLPARQRKRIARLGAVARHAAPQNQDNPDS